MHGMHTDVLSGLLKRSVRAGLALLALFLAAASTPALHAQAAHQGQWTTLPYPMPINPVHIALMNNGKVLIVSGSGNVAAETNFRAAVWDPQAQTIVTQPVKWDMFCNGMVVLPDGRVLVNGGNLQYDPFHGQLRNAAYDPATGLFTDLQNMAHGRWYPTVTMLGDGRVMTFSGLNETGGTNTSVELYTVGSGWSPEYAAGWTPPLYPRMHLLPDGTVLYSGSGTGSRIFNPSTHTWSGVVATTNYAGTRTYGSSVLLPLTPADGYKPRVMIFGGGNPATVTTEIIDMSASPLQWQYGPPMSQPRTEMNATILPSGKVLALGGSTLDENAASASLNADLYDPGTNTFSPAGANAFPRLYHSGSLLLPDATVLVVGGNPVRGTYESHMEIYSPAYLFNLDGSAAVRPAINSVSPGAITYGSTFQVQTPDAVDIASVVIVRAGAQTHAFDMEQRLVALSFTGDAGGLNVTAPPNGNIAPPGYYMLFILNVAGVPSAAGFVRLSAPLPRQAPTATITSPAANGTVGAGQSVSFSGSGSVPDGTISAYAWTFPGGNPGSSALASPFSVMYSTPGTYVASFRVTDNGGLTSPPATRTITVPNYSLTAASSSQTAAPGGRVSYTATVTAQTGFPGTVAFSVSGLPPGVSASFNPASVTASGSTTLTVSTSASTPTGSYPLTMTGTSGPVVHSVNATLVVAGDFSISVTKASRPMVRGTTYDVTIAATPGFSGTVNLSVNGVPLSVRAIFSRTSVMQSGTSVLTVTTKEEPLSLRPQSAHPSRTGGSTLSVTGTSGSLVHSTNITLMVQ
jgi:hypothetical protein